MGKHRFVLLVMMGFLFLRTKAICSNKGGNDGDNNLIFNITSASLRSADDMMEGRSYQDVDLGSMHLVSDLSIKTDVSLGLQLQHSSEFKNATDNTNNTYQTVYEHPVEVIGNSQEYTTLSPFEARYLRLWVNGTNTTSLEINVRGCLTAEQNIIKGSIQPGQTEWTSARNPYVVKGEVTLSSDMELVIHQGVEVFLLDESRFIVNGTLELKGTRLMPVVLKGYNGEKWGGITLNNGSLLMTHSILDNAQSLVSRNSETVNLLINNSIISVDILHMSSRLFNASVENSHLDFRVSSFRVRNKTESTESQLGRIQIDNSTLISNMKYGAVIDIQTDNNTSEHVLDIRNTNLRGPDGINVNSNSLQMDLHIANNSFATMEIGLSLTGDFKRLNISGNNFGDNGTVITIDLGQTVSEGPDNEIYGSHRYGYVVLDWIREKLYRTKILNTRVLITHNVFKKGHVKVTSPYRVIPPVDVSYNVFTRSFLSLGTSDVVIRQTNFRKQAIVEYIGETSKHDTIDASLNYWGCKCTALIGRKVKGYSHDAMLPRIQFMPYFRDRALRKLVKVTSFRTCMGKLGGPVGGSVVLSRDKSPYTAISDILVGRNDSLTIEAGVKILFRTGVVMTVDGSLRVEGSPELPVVMTSQNQRTPWGGLVLGRKHRPAVRLTGGKDEREGTVLIWTRKEYRPYCAHTEQHFTQSHARVACRMAGFGSDNVTIGPLISFGGEGERRSFSFTGLSCTGNETSLIECPGEAQNGCGFSFATPNKPSIRCGGDKLSGSREEHISEMILRNLQVLHTLSGVSINGHISVFENVTSRFSRSSGVTFDTMLKGDNLVINNLDSSFNEQNGVVIESDKSYRVFHFKNCTLNSNKETGIQLSGHPNVIVENCSINGNKNGMYSSYHGIVNLTVNSSTLHHNVEHGVYFKHGETVPMLLWDDVYRANVSISISNSSFIQRHQNQSKWTTSYHSLYQDNSLVCIYSGNGSFEFIGNDINNSTMRYMLKLNPQTTRVRIEGNNFVNTSSEHLIQIESRADEFYRPLGETNVTILGNRFERNHGHALVALRLGGNYLALIAENRMVDNTANYTMWMIGDRMDVVNNTFSNPDALCEVRLPHGSNVSAVLVANDFTGLGVVSEETCSNWAYSRVCDVCFKYETPTSLTP